MTIEWWRDADFHSWMSKRDSIDQSGQIALEMSSEGQEIRNDSDAFNAFGGQTGDCGGEIGFAELEKSGVDGGKSSGTRQIGCGFTHRIVGGFNARAVRKKDDVQVR